MTDTRELFFNAIAATLVDLAPNAEPNAHEFAKDVALALDVPIDDAAALAVARLLALQAKFHLAREDRAMFAAVESLLPADARATGASARKNACRKIYLASSWRNKRQPELVRILREAGHEVYDFRNPAPGDRGFSWAEIDPDWSSWTPREFIDALRSPAADRGFRFDRDALHWCDTCVLLLPCGRSAHLEAGFAVGRGKRVIVLLPEDNFEPELMYRLAHDLVTDVPELLKALSVQGKEF